MQGNYSENWKEWEFKCLYQSPKRVTSISLHHRPWIEIPQCAVNLYLYLLGIEYLCSVKNNILAIWKYAHRPSRKKVQISVESNICIWPAVIIGKKRCTIIERFIVDMCLEKRKRKGKSKQTTNKNQQSKHYHGEQKSINTFRNIGMSWDKMAPRCAKQTLSTTLTTEYVIMLLKDGTSCQSRRK